MAGAVAAAVAVGGLASTAALPDSSGDADTPPGSPRFDRVAGVPLLHGAYRDEGELADGVLVPEGTVLVGAPMPVDHRSSGTGYEYGWAATLLLVGETADVVVDDLDGQARALDLERVAAGGQDFPACRLIHRGHVRSCEATWQGPTARLSVWVARGRIPGAHVAGEFDGLHTQVDRPISTVRLRVDHPSAGHEPTDAPPARPCEPPPNGPFPEVVEAGWDMPGDWPLPPGPGDRLGDDILPTGADVPVGLLELPEAAQAVSPLSPGTGQALSYRAMVAVTGSLDAVWTSLADQIRAHVPDVDERTGRFGDGEIRTLSGSYPEGVCYALQAATVDGRSWIEVSSSLAWGLEMERRR